MVLLFLKMPLPMGVVSLAQEVPQSPWITWPVLGMRAVWLTVTPQRLFPVLLQMLLGLGATGHVSSTA